MTQPLAGLRCWAPSPAGAALGCPSNRGGCWQRRWVRRSGVGNSDSWVPGAGFAGHPVLLVWRCKGTLSRGSTQADALVFQLFKSLACFGSSLAVLLFRQLEWTGWATVGATLWVSGAVRTCGGSKRCGAPSV